jgi:long-chain fatty acid transport protein
VVTNGHLDLTTISQDLFQPAQYTAGFSARVSSRFLVAFDLAYHRWSTFENPSAHITIDLDVGQFNDLVKIPPFSPLPPPNFHDIVVPRLGMEWLATQTEDRALRVRAGYVYQPTPAPEQTGETNFIDDNRHIFSLGAGLELRHGLGEIIPRPLSLDGFVALTALEPRDHRKLSPVDPIGDYRSGGHIWSAGILSRWRF